MLNNHRVYRNVVHAAQCIAPYVVALLAAGCFAGGAAAQNSTAERSPLDDLRRRYSDEAFLQGEAGLSAAAAAGRELWYKATFGNALFNTETLTSLGFGVDWLRVLRADQRALRWQRWGLINDPSCCAPGSPGCPAQDASMTHGFDYCAGDDELLRYVGEEGYVDPACHFREAGTAARSESRCLLAFGTSAGAVGWRKFPNPRFDAQRWRETSNGRGASWEGYPARPVEERVEPPFLFGIACGACHVGFDALNVPRDPVQPQWDNLRATAGNQTLRFGAIMTSALPHTSLHAQWAAFARPGTMDTSLIENDYIANPSSINAIINLGQRPKQNGVHTLMKGGEDSTGFIDSIRRVYLSMGLCAQGCLVPHLEDADAWRPNAARYRQSPVDVQQCKHECAEFRAMDERAEDVLAFLQERDARPTDLRAARERARQREDPNAIYSQPQLIADLEREFGRNAVERGRRVFARECARCHSSMSELEAGPWRERDFLRVDNETAERSDWLGNDQPTPVTQLRTYACRALHTNHLRGNVWQPFAAEAYQRRGRGYYRNLSLLSAWAHAPFMHNDAVGPRLCREVSARACWKYDPSVEGRYRLFKASIRELLSAKRPVRRARLPTHVAIPIELPGTAAQGSGKRVELVVPRGTSQAAFGSFAVKEFARDLDQVSRSLRAQLEAGEVAPATRIVLKRLARQIRTSGRVRIDLEARELRPYLNCLDQVENAGHHFGTRLNAADKRALIAFVATL